MDTAVTMMSNRDATIAEFDRVRSETETLCSPLAVDDYQVQSSVQTSPPKWHLAHTTWLFEAFILSNFLPGYKPFNARFDFLFNSYYYTHGEIYPNSRRGMLARPTLAEVYRYRAYVNNRMRELMENVAEAKWQALLFYVTLGLNHEQQHQELLLMDIKHNFSVNPLLPVYRDDLEIPRGETRAVRWLERTGGIYQMGHDDNGFGYDNEKPRHQVLLHDCRLADRFVTNAEYLEFISDGGYADPALWLSDGWALIHQDDWRYPLYWQQIDGSWQQFTLGGLRELNPHEPVCHLSFYEAEAYARWAGKRLPLESELETLLAEQPVTGNFSDSALLHPAPAGDDGQWYGDLWAWTASPYAAYPGFKPLEGSVGEYNGKFMSNQMVLKGGCCATPAGHIRASYRNFFYPEQRWAFTGVRLAEDM